MSEGLPAEILAALADPSVVVLIAVQAVGDGRFRPQVYSPFPLSHGDLSSLLIDLTAFVSADPGLMAPLPPEAGQS